MNNFSIAEQFSLLSKLMEIHGENSFKSKSYSIAAFNIEQLPVQLSEVPHSRIFSYKGIGETIGKKIIEILDHGELEQLKELLAKTPAGVLEMLRIKGLGPKKICAIWRDMGIESAGELLYACNENRLLLYKGFGEKTQNNVQQAINFFQQSQGSYLYAAVESYAIEVDAKLKNALSNYQLEFTGDYRRQLEVIDTLQWITTAPTPLSVKVLRENAFTIISQESDSITFKGTEGVTLRLYYEPQSSFYNRLIETSSSEEFLLAFHEKTKDKPILNSTSEQDIFNAYQLPFIPAYLRESAGMLEKETIPELISVKDIKGIIHCHSNWSDGRHSIEELATACIAMKMEYLVISDHSKSAFYAKGLQEDRIREQHLYLDELNEKFAPFSIFKSIECDILTDGSLDYPNRILSTFDLVIASIHSNLKMNEEKATTRLLAAIENPYTTILGHMTGRLLLSRNGYPVNYKKIIDACAEHKVAIELNAHPRRLDMDWRWISYAIEKGVMISIDPDAHYMHGLDDIRHGVRAAQKGLLTRQHNLSSLGLQEFEAYLRKRKVMSD